MYVIGTAGHVDHGKSTLVQALTGIDPDRLREEKERGMTIDLGFAWLKLPGGEEVSIVDVPGHERFIKNMLAGVGGIDIALLVVAADEGVMPQTREHLAILDLLQVKTGVVAVTKADLVEADWLELVQADIADTLAGTSLAGAPLVACSAVTREGLPELLAALEAALARTEPKRDIGRPRLAIDRVFSVAGFGTVVTGTLIDGMLRAGQEVVVEPGGLRSRVRGLQSHKHKVERSEPGSRTAVNLGNVGTDELHRGLVLTTPGWLMPTTAVDVRLRMTADATHPLRHNAQTTFHSGSAEAPARVRLLDADELPPGGEGWAQVRLFEPVAVARGDGFVLRSPNETLGGGTVVDVHARRHRRRHEATLASLASLERGSPEESLYEVLARHEPAALDLLVRETSLGAAGVRAALAKLLEAGRAVRIGGDGDETPGPNAALYTLAGYQRLTERALAAVAAFLKEHSLRAGMPREELKSRLGLNPRLFNGLLEHWLARGDLAERGATVAPPEHAVALNAAQKAESDRFLAALRAHPYAPAPDHLPERELIAYLAESGAVVPVAEGIVFDAAAYRLMVDGIVAHLKRHPAITLAQVRDLFGTSRRYAQALLEHLDDKRVTRRLGDERVLRSPEGAVH
ncbi:MAG TPA: selenocysteine-specific translation elongation factor [Dehalococcoidia bacterium]|nr:selenocysteine-specific translation elongation factor [Dehalococcoidia bacterium]